MPLVPYNPVTGSGGGGSSGGVTPPTTAVGPTATPYTTAIPLDLVMGRELGYHLQIANEVFTLAPGSITNGWCNLTYAGDGIHTADFSAFTIVNGWTFDNTKVAELAFIKRFGTRALLSGTNTGGADLTAPQPSGAPTVANASPTIVRQAFNEALVSNGIIATDVTVSGKTVSSVAISGSELQVTVSAAFVAGDTANLSVAAAKLKDAAGNTTAAITSVAVTNNVIPTAPTVSLGTATSSTQPVTVSNPAGTTSRTVQVRTTAGPGAWGNASGSFAGDVFTVTGLAANTSYDYQASATGTAGTSAYGAFATGSTAAAGAGVLSAATFTPATTNLTSSTTPTFADYYQPGVNLSGTGAGRWTRKNGANLITFGLLGSMAYAGGYGAASFTLSGTDAIDNTSATGSTNAANNYTGYVAANDGAQAGLTFTAPAVNTFTRKFRIYMESYSDWHLVASLSDGSATPLDITLLNATPYSAHYEISFRSSNATATLTVNIQKASAAATLGAARDLGFYYATLQTA